MFANKIWWITGASSGIGAALAESLSQAGAKLILSGRNLAALKDVAGRCKTPSLILPFEATDFANIPTHVETAWTWAQGQGSGIDGLVNNAGISQRSLAVDTVFEVYRKIVDVDLMAPIALTQALLPRMVKAGGASIVAISSVAGIAGPPLRSAYAAAKHGLIGYHDSVRAETDHLGIKAVGNDQAAPVRPKCRSFKQMTGKPLWHCPEKPVAIVEVLRPLLVTRIVRQARLSLDDPNLTVRRQRHHVSAAPVRQRNFENRRQPMIEQHARNTAREQHGRVRA